LVICLFEVEENKEGLKLNGTHQLLLHADYVSFFLGGGGAKHKYHKENTKALLDP
jgi:hypothetical protein